MAGKKIYQVPTESGGFDRKEYKEEYIKTLDDLDELIGEKELPSIWTSLAPIVVPLILILCKTVFDMTGPDTGIMHEVISLIGTPIFALAVGVELAVYGLAAKTPKKEVMNIMEASIKSTGIIMLITVSLVVP